MSELFWNDPEQLSYDQIETIDLERIGPYGDYAYIIRGFKKYK